jgi:hypothetical protein
MVTERGVVHALYPCSTFLFFYGYVYVERVIFTHLQIDRATILSVFKSWNSLTRHAGCCFRYWHGPWFARGIVLSFVRRPQCFRQCLHFGDAVAG